MLNRFGYGYVYKSRDACHRVVNVNDQLEVYYGGIRSQTAKRICIPLASQAILSSFVDTKTYTGGLLMVPITGQACQPCASHENLAALSFCTTR